MPNYTKLFNSIVTSTIWAEDDKTRIVWITMLAIADKNGEVQASIPGLARVAGVSVGDAEAAINKFLSPDPYSRTPDDQGRRIEPISGGWALLNHGKYRAMASKDDAKTSNAERQRRHREKRARNSVGHNDDKCVYCGDKAAGVDHVIPKSKGGGDDAGNLVRSCHRCNKYKAAQDLVAFLNDFTKPFQLDRASILSCPVLSRKVTFSNGIFSSITQGRDIAEAEAEADTESVPLALPNSVTTSEPTRTAERPRVEVDDWSPNPNAAEAESIVGLYPANGNRYEAQAAVLRAIEAGESPRMIRSKVEAHAARYRILSPRDRQFCPALQTYFSEARWRDDPDSAPWTRHAPITRQQEIESAQKSHVPTDHLF